MKFFHFDFNKNYNKLFLNSILIICTCIVLVFFYFACSKIFDFKYQRVLDNSNKIGVINNYNYSTILKDVHENLDNYMGESFSYSGYIYRVPDINENQFILARDMIVSSDFKTVVIGFLCEYDSASNFADNTWVSISGIIDKGFFYGDIPVIKIKSINCIDTPENPLVFPPYIEADFSINDV